MRSLHKASSLERKLYLVYHQDGLLDIIVGLALLVFASVMLSKVTAFIGLIGIPSILYLPLKNQISVPRLGYIRFKPEQEQRQRLWLVLLMGVALLIGVGVFSATSGDLPTGLRSVIQSNVPLLFGAVLGSALTGVAFTLKNPRFYLYGALGLALVWIAHFIDIQLGIPVALLAVTIELVGIMTLIRFVQKYPLKNGESNG